MRKFLLSAGLVAVAAALLVPSVASAADDRILTASVAGTGVHNAGTTRVPRPVSLSVNLFTRDDRVANPFPLGSQQWLSTGFIPNPGYRDQIFLPKTIRLQSDNFPGCGVVQIVNDYRRCPQPARTGPNRGAGGSLLGSGRATAQVKGCSDPNRSASNPPPITEVVTIRLFKGPGRNVLHAQLFATSPVALNAVIIITIGNVRGSALYGKVLSFQVSDQLLARGNHIGQHDGVCIALRVVNLTVRKAFVNRRVSLGRGRFIIRRQYLAESVGCFRQLTPRPARNVYPFRNFVQFTDGFQFGIRNWRIVGSDVALAPVPVTQNCRV